MAGETTQCLICGRPQWRSGKKMGPPTAQQCMGDYDNRATELRCTVVALRSALARVTADLAAERARREQAEAALGRVKAVSDEHDADCDMLECCGCMNRVADALAPRASGEGQKP